MPLQINFFFHIQSHYVNYEIESLYFKRCEKKKEKETQREREKKNSKLNASCENREGHLKYIYKLEMSILPGAIKFRNRHFS